MSPVARITGQFFTSQQLSENRALTPEGFLLITNVPVARTGTQIYAAHELPALTPSSDGLIVVERDPEEVFRPETLASFNGKPLTDDHPSVGMLTPDSWRNFARGTVINPRRGDGLKSDGDFMYADILVTDAQMIQTIQDGKKEISAGYDAAYEGLGPGRAKCLDIVGNHVALVDKGRCGPYCAVGDKAMAVKSGVRSKFLDRFRSAVSRGNTRDALEAVSEVAHDPEALGEIISDEMAGGLGEAGGENKQHHIEVHTHLNGMPGVSASNGGPAKDIDPAAATATPAVTPGATPAAAGGDVGAQIQALAQRLDNIEQILMSLADDDGTGGAGEVEGAGEGEGGDGIGDRRIRDTDIGTESKVWPETGSVEQGAGYHEEKGAPDLPRESPGTKDQRRAAVGDSTSMRTAFVATLSKAETLCPGIRLPTFDAASPAKDTFESMCSFRRKVLDAAYKTDEARPAIESVIDGRRAQFFDKSWTCDAVAVAFNGASAIMAQKIQHRVVSPRVGASGGNNGFGKAPPTPAELNARARTVFKLDA
jgi:hypothetical protein